MTVPWLRHIRAGLLLQRLLWPGLFLVGFVVGALALGQVFSPRTSVFRCHVNSSCAPASCHLCSHSYQYDVRAKPADPTKKSDARLKTRGASEKKVFLFVELYCQIYPPSWRKSRAAVRFTFAVIMCKIADVTTHVSRT